MIYSSGTKSLGLEGKGLKPILENSLQKNKYSNKKDNSQEYLLKIKDKYPNNDLLSES